MITEESIRQHIQKDICIYVYENDKKQNGFRCYKEDVFSFEDLFNFDFCISRHNMINLFFLLFQ